MNARARCFWFAGVLTSLLVSISLVPMRWKIASGLATRSYALDFVSSPLLARLFGPVVFINPHLIAHVAAFCGLTLALFWLLCAYMNRWVIAIFTIALAIFTEAAQHFVYRSPFEWVDVRTDLAAITAAICIGTLLWRRSLRYSSMAEPQPE